MGPTVNSSSTDYLGGSRSDSSITSICCNGFVNLLSHTFINLWIIY